MSKSSDLEESSVGELLAPQPPTSVHLLRIFSPNKENEDEIVSYLSLKGTVTRGFFRFIWSVQIALA